MRRVPNASGRGQLDLPRVAVVVPSFNHGRYLEQCLRSILDQSHPPAELVVIDDGSSDGSVALAERVLRDAPCRTELVACPHRGLGAVLNQGLARTRGELFAYLGSDDRWGPGRLRSAALALRANPEAVLAFGSCYLIDEADHLVGVSHRRLKYRSRDVRASLLRLDFVPASPTVTFRRTAVERFGWNESAQLEDYELYLRLATAGEFAFVDEPLAYWRWHGGNATWRCDRMLAEILAAQERCAPLLGLDEHQLREYRRHARFRYAYHFLLAGQRGRAVRETLGNLRGARSPLDVADRLVRLALPLAVLACLRRRRLRGLAQPEGW